MPAERACGRGGDTCALGIIPPRGGVDTVDPETEEGILDCLRLDLDGSGSGRQVGTIGLGATALSCTVSQ